MGYNGATEAKVKSMDRRVFEPRPSGNDVRCRNSLSIAMVVLAALALLLHVLRANSRIVPVTAPAPQGPSATMSDQMKERNNE